MSHGINQRKNGRIRKALPVMLAFLPLLGGCVFSVYPWYTMEQGNADPELLGVWSELDSANEWTFSATESGVAMTLLAREEKSVGEFNAVAFKHGDWHFLDLAPSGSSIPDGSVSWHLLPMHGLFAYHLADDTLRIRQLSADALLKNLEEIEHPALLNAENRWIFTGSNEEMAALVPARLLVDSLYVDHLVLVRR